MLNILRGKEYFHPYNARYSMQCTALLDFQGLDHFKYLLRIIWLKS